MHLVARKPHCTRGCKNIRVQLSNANVLINLASYKNQSTDTLLSSYTAWSFLLLLPFPASSSTRFVMFSVSARFLALTCILLSACVLSQSGPPPSSFPHDYPGKPSGDFSPLWQNCTETHLVTCTLVKVLKYAPRLSR